jgi:crotonobetainyl-CoA:carnitine CoA-transferase CaiB-like acyl-CoA transferase
MTAPTGPLKSVKVFDLTRVLAGPTCVQMLADLGADVVKIERPGSGDDTRWFAPPFMPGTKESAYFVGVNRNKRSITLDISKPEGQEIALGLIAQSDILVENFKLGTLARYGLGYTQLHEKFPGLVYCSITGFGQTGPYAGRPGYDSLIQAMGGVMSLTGEPDGPPQKVGIRQIIARGALVHMPHPSTPHGVDVIANPVRLSETPADYRLPPPLLGQHTDEILIERLAFDEAKLAALRRKGVS